MSEQPTSRTKLLAGVFHADWENGPPGDFARAAAAHARQRRRVRRALVVAGSTAGVAAALLFSLLPRATPLRPTTPAASAPAYEIVSDAEMLSLLDRPALLARNSDGHQQLIWLDEIH